MSTIYELMEDNIVAVSDTQERLEELQGTFDCFDVDDEKQEWLKSDEGVEYLAVKKLVAEIETCRGDTLISDSHISDYVESLVDEIIGDNEALNSNIWPYSCYKLDLDQAVKEYTVYLSSVLFNGETFWVQ